MARGDKKTEASVKPINPAESLPFPSRAISDRLLAWYGRKGRDLPWRNTRDPYRVWLSEVMLQQTTVAAVVPYYHRFLDRFPTLQVLAEASLDEVIQYWAGLGYYSRARNLHRAARQVAAEFGGNFPDTQEELCALPGIGRSTAGAILSIAFDQPAPILDGNVRRVLVRLFAWTEDPRSSRAERRLWQWAEVLTPSDRAHDYAQAIMDLGAMVCVPRRPSCRFCPLNDFCRAFQEGLADILPLKRPRKAVPLRRQAVLLACWQARLLVTRRPPKGLLGGLWEFPVVDLNQAQPHGKQLQRLQNDLGLPGNLRHLGTIRHVYSHFKLELEVHALDLEDRLLVAEGEQRWCPMNELSQLPLHGAHDKALEVFLKDVERE